MIKRNKLFGGAIAAVAVLMLAMSFPSVRATVTAPFADTFGGGVSGSMTTPGI